MFVNSFIVLNGQAISMISIDDYLSQMAEKHNLHFAYPIGLVEDIKIKKTNQSFSTVCEELRYYLTQAGMEVQEIDDHHLLLRKRNEPNSIDENISLKVVLRDAHNDEALAYASVFLDDYSHSAMSDLSGKCILAISPTDLEKYIVVSFIGYEERKIKVKDAMSNKVIHLKQANNAIDEVVISHIISPLLLDAYKGSVQIHIDPAANNTNAILRQDGLRTIQMMAGVSAHDDQSAGVKLRGGNADETPIIADDIPLYQIEHYDGLIGAVNSDYFRHLSLYKNHLPVEYQGGLAGLLKVSSDKKIADSGLHFNINSFSTSLLGKLKFNESAGLIISGRSTYRDIFSASRDNGFVVDNFRNSKLIIREIFPYYKFQDFNAKFYYHITPKWIVDISAMQSYDQSNASFQSSINAFGNVVDIKRDEYEKTTKSKGASFHLIHLINTHSSIKLVGQSSIFKKDEFNKSSLTYKNSTGQIEVKNLISDFEEYVSDSGAKVYLENDHEELTATYGIEWKRYDVLNKESINNKRLIDNDAANDLVSLFASHQYKWERFKINPALRISQFTHGDYKLRLSPQVSSVYQLDDSIQLKTFIGVNHQFLREASYETPFGQSYQIWSLAGNGQIPIGRSTNYMIGFNQTNSNLMLDAELWYKDMHGAINILPSNALFNINPDEALQYQILSGQRRAYGLDLMISYLYKNYKTQAAYTISRVEDKFAELYNQRWTSSANDRRHQFKWLNEYTLGHFVFSHTLIATSGKPYLSFENVENLKRGDEKNRRLITYLPAYQRMDFGVKYPFKLAKSKANLGLSLFNVFDRQNYSYIQYNFKYDPNKGQSGVKNDLTLGTTQGQLGRTLTFDFNFWF